MSVIATSSSGIVDLGFGVSTNAVETEVDLIPPGDSAMQQLRSAVRAVLMRAADGRSELLAALPAVLTQIGDSSRSRLRGSFAEEHWELGHSSLLHEIFISGRHLDRDAESVATTIVHELAHLLASVRGVRDTSNRGRYHSKRFKEVAEELGLLVEYRQPHGFYTTGLSLDLCRRLDRELCDLAAALVLRVRDAVPTAGGVGIEGTAVSSSSRRKYITAACGCSKVFRMAVGHWVPHTIPCDVCGEYFTDVRSRPSGFKAPGRAGRLGRPEISNRHGSHVLATPNLTSITTTSKEIK